MKLFQLVNSVPVTLLYVLNSSSINQKENRNGVQSRFTRIVVNT